MTQQTLQSSTSDTEAQSLDQDVQESASVTESPDSTDRFLLSYQNSHGNAAVIRSYTRHDGGIREVNEEWMYNYMDEAWQQVHQFVRDYDLADDGETLVGDGSNWRGTGREWRAWFLQRHRELLEKRFPYDDLEAVDPEAFRDVTQLATELRDACPLATETASDWNDT